MNRYALCEGAQLPPGGYPGSDAYEGAQLPPGGYPGSTAYENTARVPQRPRGRRRKEGPRVSAAPFQKLLPEFATDAVIFEAENGSYTGSTPALLGKRVMVRRWEASHWGRYVNLPECKSCHCSNA